MNEDLIEKQKLLIQNNVNVGKTSLLKEICSLLFGLFAFCFTIYIFADLFAICFINTIPNKTQLKIEKTLEYLECSGYKTKRIQKAETIKQKLISLDKNLQNMSDFKLLEDKTKEINAYVLPNGTIYLTSGLLDEIKDEETLAFVLAHEMGHYAHRDHLKGIAREVLSGVVLSILTSGQRDISRLVSATSEFNRIKYSKKQEIDADKYALNAVQKMYGTNKGAILLFETLDKNMDAPEFLYYFSTHPSPKERIKLIKKAI